MRFERVLSRPEKVGGTRSGLLGQLLIMNVIMKAVIFLSDLGVYRTPEFKTTVKPTLFVVCHAKVIVHNDNASFLCNSIGKIVFGVRHYTLERRKGLKCPCARLVRCPMIPVHVCVHRTFRRQAQNGNTRILNSSLLGLRAVLRARVSSRLVFARFTKLRNTNVTNRGTNASAPRFFLAFYLRH